MGGRPVGVPLTPPNRGFLKNATLIHYCNPASWLPGLRARHRHKSIYDPLANGVQPWILPAKYEMLLVNLPNFKCHR